MTGSSSEAIGADRATLRMLMAYKGWANGIAYDAVEAIPESEALKPRMSTFGTIAATLNHVLVVDDIFRHHLTGRRHGYATRNTDEIPAIAELRRRTAEMDTWYAGEVERWSERELAETIQFEFVGGGDGALTRAEIVLHVVNHATYHRGFVGDMLRQVPYVWPANDLTVFIRDHFRSA